MDEESSEFFDTLSPIERKIVYLKYIKKLSAKDIEKEYMISQARVYYLIRIIKEKARKFR